MNQKQIRAAVEAMLFAYAEPIGADKLAQALQLPTASVESALEALHERCQKEDSGLCLLHLNTIGSWPPKRTLRRAAAVCWTPAAPSRWALRPWRP